MSISLADNVQKRRGARHFIGRTTVVAVVMVLFATLAPAGAQAAPAPPSPVEPAAVGFLTTEDDFTTEVPAAYLQEGAPEWVEYEDSASIAAVGDPCTKPVCGRIVNKGSILFVVSTDYTTNGQVASGSVKKNLLPGQEASFPYDWDAVYVPAGYCGTFFTGAGYYFRSTNSRVGMSTGWWHKLDDLGGHAIVRQGSCA